jgi:type I restriction enzyme S subunit
MKTVALSKVAKINMGQSPLSESYNKIGDGLPFFQGKTDFGDMYPKIRVFCTSPNKIAEADDILLSVRAPVGSINICKTKSCIGRGLAAIRAKSEIEQKYLYHFLNFYEPQLAQIGKGSTFEAVNREDVENIQIPLPNPDEQKRIAEILDKADRLRRQRRYAQTLSDSFLQSVFIKMFGDPVSNSMNWDVSLLGKACVPKDGIKAGPFGSSIKKESYSETGYRVYGQEQVIVDNYRIGNYRISEKKFQEMKTYAVQPDDVLISLVGTFGKVSIVPKDAELGIINPRLIRIRFNQNKLKSQFFVAMFRNQAFLRKMGVMSHGGTMGVLNGTQLKEIEIIIPPLPLQEKFAAIVQKFERVRRQQGEATRQAEHLFQTLLHRAFRGEL